MRICSPYYQKCENYTNSLRFLFKLLFTILPIIFIQACAYNPYSYQVSENIQNRLAHETNKVSVVTDKSPLNSLKSRVCRGRMLSAPGPNNASFASYIVGALKEELRNAGKLDSNGIKLHVKFEKIDFSTTTGGANWYINANYRIADKNFDVSTIYHTRSSLFGNAECGNIALNFSKAVKQHLEQLFDNSKLKIALGYNNKKIKSTSNIENKSTSNIENKLRELAKLYKEGLISKSEYEKKKQEILNKM